MSKFFFYNLWLKLYQVIIIQNSVHAQSTLGYGVFRVGKQEDKRNRIKTT